MRRLKAGRNRREGGRCFFFSSRRRHTRFDCDWSSDVCSSDLTRAGSVVGVLAPGASAGASAELLGLADARAAAVVERAAPAVGRLFAPGTRAPLMISAGPAALGARPFLASPPRAGGGAPVSPPPPPPA